MVVLESINPFYSLKATMRMTKPDKRKVIIAASGHCCSHKPRINAVTINTSFHSLHKALFIFS